ncbi:hypothetical protein AC626_22765, partial [Pseudoalteromonas rubra]
PSSDHCGRYGHDDSGNDVSGSTGPYGRPLTPHPLMSVAFLLIALSALIRSLLGEHIGPHMAWQVSALIWSAGFALFVFSMAPC